MARAGPKKAHRDSLKFKVKAVKLSQMKAESPKVQLDGFLAKFKPEVRAIAKAALAKMRRRLPGALELVYDNYNALAIGFGPSERAGEAIFSIALFPRWVSLFFLQSGATLPDPQGLLKGTGKRARHIVLASAADLDTPAVQALMKQALARAVKPIDSRGTNRTIIKSVSAKQRPRRPAQQVSG